MVNKIISLLILPVLFLILAGSANAATSIRLQQPASPTNNGSFNITFVALDTDNNPVTVQCYQDGVAFGSPITLSNGGNTDVCQVNLSSNGTYSFYAVANSTTSNTVSVDYNTSTPGAPVNYSKDNLDGCNYKISFRTAPDGGKTVKVVLYRSPNSNFDVNAGSQVDSQNIGSDTDGSFNNNVPDCTKTYYFAIRAFDAYGNGSGVVGDSTTITSTTTTIVNPTITGGQGAIPVSGGEVLGGAAGQPTKEVLGTQSAKPKVTTPTKTNPLLNALTWPLGHKKISLLVLIIILAPIAYYLYRRFGKRVK